MNEETTAETAQKGAEEPRETNGLSVEPEILAQDTKDETEVLVSKKPRETHVYNHGTGYVTFVQALKLITASKATLSRYTNDRKIPYVTDDRGNKLYQVVDLERVFGKLKSLETEVEVTDEEQGNHEKHIEPDHETALKLALLEQENKFLKEKAQRAEKEAADWKQQAERVTLMLTHRPETPAVPEVQPEPVPEAKQGFFSRLFGGH
jgi:myosin heavy subunit